MTIKEYRKWINSLPKELDGFELVHREYYDSTDDEILGKETEVYSVHIDNPNKKLVICTKIIYEIPRGK